MRRFLRNVFNSDGSLACTVGYDDAYVNSPKSLARLLSIANGTFLRFWDAIDDEWLRLAGYVF